MKKFSDDIEIFNDHINSQNSFYVCYIAFCSHCTLSRGCKTVENRCIHYYKKKNSHAIGMLGL